MSSSGKPTLHLGLNQWLPNDKPERADFNSNNQKIDVAFNSITQEMTVVKQNINAQTFTSGTWTPVIMDSTLNTPAQKGEGTWKITDKSARLKGKITLSANTMTAYQAIITTPFSILFPTSLPLGNVDVDYLTLPTGATQVCIFPFSASYLTFRYMGSGIASGLIGGNRFSSTATIMFDITVDIP